MHNHVIFQPRRCVRLLLLAGGVTAFMLVSGCGSSPKGKAATTASAPAPSAGQSTPTTASGTTSGTSTSSTSKSSSSSSTTVTARSGAALVSGSAGGVTASMHPAGHHPKVKVPWPISFTVTRHGRAAQASVSYEYLFAGQVVARRSHYTFTGRFSDVFHWPASAVGYPLTFRAVIVSGGVTINLDYPVQVIA